MRFCQLPGLGIILAFDGAYQIGVDGGLGFRIQLQSWQPHQCGELGLEVDLGAGQSGGLRAYGHLDVEAAVGPPGRDRFGAGPQPVGQGVQPGHIGPAAAAGGEHRGRAGDGELRVAEVAQFRETHLLQSRRRGVFQGLRGRADETSAPASALGADDALLPEYGQGLTQRHRRDTQLVGEGQLARQLLAVHHHPEADRRGQPLDHGLGFRSAAQLVGAIRSAMTGPPFQAALELWAASRTDTQLRAALLPAEKRLGSALRAMFRQHAGIADPEAARTAFETLMALVRGLELTRLMRADPTVADRIVDDWLHSVDRLRGS